LVSNFALDVYVHTYVCMYVCMYVYMYVCIYICMYVCIYVCMYVPPRVIKFGEFSPFGWLFSLVSCKKITEEATGKSYVVSRYDKNMTKHFYRINGQIRSELIKWFQTYFVRTKELAWQSGIGR
jgi:hypothetical protein